MSICKRVRVRNSSSLFLGRPNIRIQYSRLGLGIHKCDSQSNSLCNPLQ